MSDRPPQSASRSIGIFCFDDLTTMSFIKNGADWLRFLYCESPIVLFDVETIKGFLFNIYLSRF